MLALYLIVNSTIFLNRIFKLMQRWLRRHRVWNLRLWMRVQTLAMSLNLFLKCTECSALLVPSKLIRDDDSFSFCWLLRVNRVRYCVYRLFLLGFIYTIYLYYFFSSVIIFTVLFLFTNCVCIFLLFFSFPVNCYVIYVITDSYFTVFILIPLV